jgi:hypothetical protein
VLDELGLDLNDPRLFEGMLMLGEALSIDLAIHEASGGTAKSRWWSRTTSPPP